MRHPAASSGADSSSYSSSYSSTGAGCLHHSVGAAVSSALSEAASTAVSEAASSAVSEAASSAVSEALQLQQHRCSRVLAAAGDSTAVCRVLSSLITQHLLEMAARADSWTE